MGLTLNGTVNVAGLLKVMPGALVQPDPYNNWNGRVKVFTQLPEVSGGTYNAMTTIAGPLVATRNESFSQGLFIENGGSLRLAGHKITAANMGVMRGTFTMDTPNDTLIITSGASFNGVANLSAGTFIDHGILYVNPDTLSMPGAG